MLSLLKRSCPAPFVQDLSGRLKSHGSTALFVAIFIWVFEPAELNNLPASTLSIGLLYAFLSFVDLYLVETLFRFTIPAQRWNFGWQTLYSTTCAILNGFICYFTAVAMELFPHDMSLLLWHQYFSFSVAVLITLGKVMLRYNRFLRRRLIEVEELNQTLKERLNTSPPDKGDIKVTLESSDATGSHEFQLSNLLFIKAADNYIEVHHMSDEEVKETLIRTTLKSAQTSLQEHDEIFHCHRSYLVNLNKVSGICGTAPAYKLQLENTSSHLIPVSRNRIQSLKQIIMNPAGFNQEASSAI